MTNDFYTENNVLYCQALSDIPYIAHGFSTRSGGVSELEYTRELNLGYCRGDDDAAVNTNRALFAKYAGFDPGGLVCSDQIHSDRIAVCDGLKKHYAGYDGFVSRTRGVFISVKTADCLPVLLADGKNGVVGVCHAGWRGTAKLIAKKTVDAMVSEGAEGKNVTAALGPCICAGCFTVKEDFVAEFEKNAPELLPFIYEKDGIYHADIKGMNRYALLSAGLYEENIHVCPECTFCSGDKYYSHRRQKGHRGTMMNVIGIKEDITSE